MLKKCLILFLCLSSFLFGNIIDGADLLKEENKKNLEKRLSFLEESRDLKFIIETQKNEKDFSEFNDAKKTVKINILKGEKKVNIRLFFSKDALKLGYSDEIDGLLERVDPLIKSGNYIDLIYEITGEIADINQVSNEQIETESEESSSQKGNKLWVIILGIILFLIILKILKNKNKITRCDECNLKMTLIAEYEEGNKKYKDYKCTVCGKEITKYTWG
ncbi:MAG: hypothetical protein ACQERZ_02115 [Fusobacteriota bacterium]